MEPGANLLTTEQVARRLGKSVSQVNRLAKAGRLSPAIQFPGQTGARMYETADVLDFIDSLAPEAAAPGGFGGEGPGREGVPVAPSRAREQRSA